MNILVFGTGLQGRAALHDLEQQPDVKQIIAADCNPWQVEPFLKQTGARKIQLVQADARDDDQIQTLLKNVDAVISLLPVTLHTKVTRLAVKSGVHVINSSYTTREILALHDEAVQNGTAILPECGLDPGIDLVLSAQAVRELDEVEAYYSYGTGVPEPSAANNPLRYKVSWTLPGVLRAYLRDSRIIRDGRIIDIPGTEIFAPENNHSIQFGKWGEMDAYPNGDVTGFVEKLGIGSTVIQAGRFATRWPGHNVFWYKLALLGFLSDKPIEVGGVPVKPNEFLAALLEPQLQYGSEEKDLAMLRIEVHGRRAGLRRRIVYELVDERDLKTGLLAMNRTVGYAASIGTLLILRGQIPERGVLSPLKDIPFDAFIQELNQRGIQVSRFEDIWE